MKEYLLSSDANFFSSGLLFNINIHGIIILPVV
jgi:hypothetical protein